MPLRLRSLLVATLLLAAVVPGATPAFAARAATFVFGGEVAEPGGRPVRGARLLLRGLLEPAAQTDAEGRFSFSYVVPDVEAFAAAPLLLVLCASHRSWNLALPTGGNALAVELRIVRTADGDARLEVRSNDAAVAKSVAASFRAPGDATVALRGRFMRQLGDEDRAPPPLTALEIVPVARPAPAGGVATATPAARDVEPAPAPAARSDTTNVSPQPEARPARPRPESLRLFPSAPDPGTTPKPAARVTATPLQADSPRARVIARAPTAERRPTPRTGGSRVAPDTAVTSHPGIRVSVRPDTLAPSPPDAGSAMAGGALRVALGRALPDAKPPAATGRACECPVKGTVEVSSDQPLRATLRVIVSLAGMPARCDTVALFMGPPRPFDLGLVPCGSRRLEVRPLSTRPFKVSPPALDAFECRAGWSQQIRVVLKPQ